MTHTQPPRRNPAQPPFPSNPAERAQAAATTAEQYAQLIAELRASTAAQRELADAVRMLAAAVHAQADAIAAAVGEEPEPATGDAPEHDGAAPHGRYVDGEPIGA
jgi:hypothetical protein